MSHKVDQKAEVKISYTAVKNPPPKKEDENVKR